METGIQEVRKDLARLKDDVALIKEFLLSGKTLEITVSDEGLKKEFQGWDSLSDEALENFEKKL